MSDDAPTATLAALERANEAAHAAFLAVMRKQRDTTRWPRGAVAAYRRVLQADRAYSEALAAHNQQQTAEASR